MASIAEVRAIIKDFKVSVVEVHAGEDAGAFRGYRYTQCEGTSIRRSFAGHQTAVFSLPVPKGETVSKPSRIKFSVPDPRAECPATML